MDQPTLMTPHPIDALMERIKALPEDARDRAREKLLGALTEFNAYLAEVAQTPPESAAAAQEKLAVFLGKMTDIVKRAEAEVRVVGVPMPAKPLACRYCGTTFPVPSPDILGKMRERMVKHMEALHPKQWEAELRRDRP
jgi:hypothetical protein